MFNIDYGTGKICIELTTPTYQNLKYEIEKYIKDIRDYNVVNGDNEIINENTDLSKLKNHELLVILKGNNSTTNDEDLNNNNFYDNTILTILSDELNNIKEEVINKEQKKKLQNMFIIKEDLKNKFQEEENIHKNKLNELKKEIEQYSTIKNKLKVEIEEKKVTLKNLFEIYENMEKNLQIIETQIQDKINDYKKDGIFQKIFFENKKNEEDLEKKNDKINQVNKIFQNDIVKHYQLKEKELNKIIKEQNQKVNLLMLKLNKEIILKKNFEDRKKQYFNKLSENINLYFNQIQQNFLTNIKKKIDERIEFYINKCNELENSRNLRFTEEKKKYENIKLALLEEYKETKIIHFNTKCNKCKDNPIKGILYKCSHCNEYYLCEKCEEINYLDKIHPFNFIKIRKPPHIHNLNNLNI